MTRRHHCPGLVAALLLVTSGCDPGYECGELEYDRDEGRCVCPDGLVLRDGGTCAPPDQSDAAVPDGGTPCVPGAELCNGSDDDCDDRTDEGEIDCGELPAGALTTMCRAARCEVASCEPDLRDCDGELDNGCEVDLRESVAHCGACDQACDVDETCRASSCVALPLGEWFVQAGSTGAEFIGDLARHPDVENDSTALVGTLGASGSFGTIAMTGSAGQPSAFVGVAGTGGAPRWADTIRASRGANARLVTIDGAGNVYVVGDYDGTLEFAGTTLTTSMRRGFLASYSGLGARRWIHEIRGTSPSDIAVAATGDVVLAGTFVTSATIGTRTFTSSGSAGYVALVQANDLIRTVLVIAPTSGGASVARVVTTTDSIFALGSVGGPITFGTSTFAAAPGTVLARVGNDGAAGALVPLGVPNPTGLALGGDTMIVTGEFSGSLTVAGRTIEATSFGSAYVASFGTDGTGRWVVLAATASNRASAGSPVIDDEGNVTFAVGGSGSTITVLGQDFAAERNRLTLLASVTRDGAPRWIESLVDSDAVAAASAEARGRDVVVAFHANSLGVAGLDQPTLGYSDVYLVSLRGR
ncbi:trypsin inhibitor-like cysteine-rich domain-containing protein [Sandaracinus amylolyticus]|uniref:trypsin inhibitor-like cysteine-rich domain-containing protein n=1 Tax=Sandaracinus amylolyticus TaxID=927083 RepID=UPI001F241F40|nr:trypsin inhibitor-like cysteine-rich domain-containing protein [Sandaracinus amylolyticus]UJR79540.1 Hypothetical protein I5071_15760 [Sandaracinus amylolyticus]